MPRGCAITDPRPYLFSAHIATIADRMMKVRHMGYLPPEMPDHPAGDPVEQMPPVGETMGVPQFAYGGNFACQDGGEFPGRSGGDDDGSRLRHPDTRS